MIERDEMERGISYGTRETYTGARATPNLVGRGGELKIIENAIRDTSMPYTIYIQGHGGIGKTCIVRHVLAHPPEGVPLVVATALIDMYHTRVHSLAGLISAILEVVPGLDDFFKEQLEKRPKEVGDKTLGEILVALSDAKSAGRHKDLADFFLEILREFTRQNRLVIALDTTERLRIEREPIQELLELPHHIHYILDWLLKDFLPGLDNAVVLLAGRQEGGLENALKEVGGLNPRQINLEGLDEAAAVDYFEAVRESAVEGDDEQTVQFITELSEDEKRAIFYCLCEEGKDGKKRIRPILLALAIDHLVVSGRVLPSLGISLEKARKLGWKERQNIQGELKNELVSTLRENRRPGDDIVLALGWLRRGADAELLSEVTGLDIGEVEKAIEQIKDLSFIKIRPDDKRLFLHDEMYDMLREGLNRIPDPQRERVFAAVKDYYEKKAKEAGDRIAELYQMWPEAGLPEAGEGIRAQANLRDALVEDVYYQLRRNAEKGFQLYFRHAEDAIAANDENLDVQLRIELRSFIAERDPSGESEEIGGLRRADVEADAAIRWVNRLVWEGEHEEAMRLIGSLRGEARELVEAGGDLAEAELVVWEALMRPYTGKLREIEKEVEESLTNVIKRLEGLPHSVRWAGILARAYNNLGYILRMQGRHYGALKAYERALPLWKATGIRIEQANTLNNRAFALAEVGGFETAWQLAWDGLELRKGFGLREPVIFSLNTLAHIRIRSGDLRGAINLAKGAVEVFNLLDHKRGMGMALIAQAEAERRISDWSTHFPHESAGQLEMAAQHAEQAAQIFKEEVSEPERLAEALLEVGCAYRDWAKLRRDYTEQYLSEGEKEKGAYSVEELVEKSKRAFVEAAEVTEREGIAHRHVDALVNRAWLRYYTELHTDVEAPDFEKARKSLEKELAQIEKRVPSGYRITEERGRPEINREGAIVPLLIQLGKLEILRGQIAVNYFRITGDENALKEAVEHYTLSLAYDTLLSDDVFRDMRRGMDRMYERLKELSISEMRTVYDTVEDVERRYRLGHSQMSEFLQESFGSREQLIDIEL